MEVWQVLVIFIFHFKGENYCARDNTYPIDLYRTNYPVEKNQESKFGEIIIIFILLVASLIVF